VRVRTGVVIATLLLTAAGATGCAGSSDDARPSTGAATSVTTGAATVPIGGRTRLDGFGEVTVTVTDEQGQAHTFCLLLAETPQQQERGLMFVTDPGLGGYDGMLFSYERDDEGAFWMRSTRLPLSIAWVRADGRTVSTADMSPCPDSASTCPSYPPGGAYRFAIEVPQGRLDDLGISAGSRVELGERGCPPA
jgi:uncharacterized membrane protein (UPF0127 family)